MPDLKLGKLPDCAPVKLTISLSPKTNARLEEYCRVYAEAYGSAEPIATLIPPMLEAFLNSDRVFARRHKQAD
jgi:hypothetical protein